jgi:hypothetical protein
MKSTLLFRSLVLGCLAAAAAQAQSDSRQEFVCQFNGETRIVSVHGGTHESGEPAGCRVDYTKGGVTKTLWNSRSDRRYCAQKAIELVTSLSNAQFKCTPRTIEKPGDDIAADPTRDR